MARNPSLFTVSRAGGRMIAFAALAAALVLIGGCVKRVEPPPLSEAEIAHASGQTARTSSRPPRGDTDNPEANDDRRKEVEKFLLSEQGARAAYRRGVRDTMEEFRGRREGRERFVWQPMLVEHVEVPAGIRNGAFRPSHTEPVIVSPGRWVEHNRVQLPKRPDHAESSERMKVLDHDRRGQ